MHAAARSWTSSILAKSLLLRSLFGSIWVPFHPTMEPDGTNMEPDGTNMEPDGTRMEPRRNQNGTKTEPKPKPPTGIERYSYALGHRAVSVYQAVPVT
ncbi:hypothetical protein THAOC_22175, partial [Thalassiosira oceanica]